MSDDEIMDDESLSNSDSSEDELHEQPIESLVAGRARRATAGNRYDRGMVLEEAADAEDQDEVTLLFADNEEEEDEEFKSDAEVEDADMSSSDDDDQGPNAVPDDMDGENELQTQAKQERAKKRKADLTLTSVAGVKKKLKTDPTRRPTATVQAKPSKKKERVTWVHDQDSGRSSLRKQTIAHRAETIARLKESEAQSKKMKALKEKRDRERARDAPKELTQADRLAEAARVERQNAKSLNRWEATEKKRQEEQAAKLAALKNGKLEGAVVTWLSQKVKWYGPEVSKVGIKDATELNGPKKRGRKSKAELEQIAAGKAADSTVAAPGPITTEPATSAVPAISDQPKQPLQGAAQEQTPPPVSALETSQTPAVVPAAEGPAEDPDASLRGIHEYANQQAESNASGSKPETPTAQDSDMQQDVEMKETTQDTETKKTTPQNIERKADAGPKDGIVMTNSPDSTLQPTSNQMLSGEGVEIGAVKTEVSIDQTPTATPAIPDQQPPTPMIIELESAPGPPPIEEDSTRNLLLLEKFDELSGDARQEYSFFYNKKTARTSARAVKASQELCPITTSPVRYRDPSTGIAYANALAYKKLQELKEHKFAWSSMLGCYVGLEGDVAARGVPEGWS